jgi:NADH-quinone oxidoreductase chain I
MGFRLPGSGILQGMGVTLLHLFRKPVTVQYPEERVVLSPRFRGAPSLVLDQITGLAKCVGCGICVRACPKGVITLRLATMPNGMRWIEEYAIDINRCLFCGYCEEACPFDAVVMSPEFELAGYHQYRRSWDARYWQHPPQAIPEATQPGMTRANVE